MFSLLLEIGWAWTKWFLPINIRWTRYLYSARLHLGLLWLIRLDITFPFFYNEKAARKLVSHGKYI